MAKISVEDDSKVMDVAKPGKGKIMGTSRPVIAPITSDAPSKEDISATLPDSEIAAPLAPSATKKIIQPISVSDEEPAETPAPSDPAEPVEGAEKAAEETAPAAETPQEASKTEEVAATDSSDAASVDAVAEGVGAKKEAIKKAEEQAKRDAAVQELINSKKYVVPIGHDGPGAKVGRRPGLLLFLPVVLLVAGYLLADANVFNPGFDLPYEFIKEDEPVEDTPAPAETAPTQTEETEDAAAGSTQPDDTTAMVASNDEVRKTEVKNLQQKLEMYFNDNDAYPATLAGLAPAPAADETTGPGGDAYTYTPSASLESYVLSADLENDSDKDADANGNYVVLSLNQ